MLQDTITAQLAALTAPLTASITQAFNDGVASVSSPTGDVTQAQEQIDIAAAVAAAIGPLNDQITALQLAKSTEDALLASVQAAINGLAALLAPPAPITPPAGVTGS